MSRIRDERGVAMVTVLFIGAVLTVSSSTAFFVTIQDFRAGDDERRAAQALAYAEAGIDRFLLEIPGIDWGEMMVSGCNGRPLQQLDGSIGNGTYHVELRPVTCPPVGVIPRPRQERSERVTLTSTGEHPAARRVVQQLVELKPKGLPIALYAETRADTGGAGGGVRITNASMITPGNLSGRDQLEFFGTDPYYSRHDMWPSFFPDFEDPGQLVSAAHAGGQITCQTTTPCGPDRIEHTSDDINAGGMNCRANNGTQPWRAAWDGSNSSAAGTTSVPTCVGSTIGRPPTTRFTPADARRLAPQPLTDEEIESLRSKAIASGLYCTYNATGSGTCRVKGGTAFARGVGSTFTTNEINGFALPKNFIAFFDFAGSDPKGSNNTIGWNADVSQCVLNQPDQSRSVVFMAPNGSIDMGAGAGTNGSIFAPRGRLRTAGGSVLRGTVFVDELDIRGGSSFVLDECFLQNLPFPLLSVTPLSWREIDR